VPAELLIKHFAFSDERIFSHWLMLLPINIKSIESILGYISTADIIKLT